NRDSHHDQRYTHEFGDDGGYRDRPRFKGKDLWSKSFWVVDRLGTKKGGQRNGARSKQRYQNDSNRWRTGESPLPAARNHKRRAHFVTDFGTSERTGLQRIHESSESQIPLSRNRLVTTDAFIRNRPQTLNRFLRATLEGIKYAKANPDFTVRVLGQYTRNTDTKLLASAFKSYILGYIRDVPTVTLPEMEAV